MLIYASIFLFSESTKTVIIIIYIMLGFGAVCQFTHFIKQTF